MCTDAEEILGIGDWGVGGIQIAVGKLAVYTAAAGIDPRRVIPVSLDVGTDNEALLNDPLYLGNRHARVRGDAYDTFIEKYLQTASSLFPNALLHFEDFGPGNARRILRPTGTGTGSSTTTCRAPARSPWPRCWPRSRSPGPDARPAAGGVRCRHRGRRHRRPDP